jgi:hypothetical protein
MYRKNRLSIRGRKNTEPTKNMDQKSEDILDVIVAVKGVEYL